MTDSYRDLHNDAYAEWKDERADEFAAIQRRAFKAGFEAAAEESKQFRLLREWLEAQRDEAHERFDETDDINDFARYQAYVDVLVRLSEMGCQPTDDE